VERSPGEGVKGKGREVAEIEKLKIV